MSDFGKVLHLVSADCEWEAAVNIASLAAGLREHGLASAITAPDHSRLQELAEAAGVEVIDYALTASANPLRWRDLSLLIKNGGYGLVHAHDPDAARQLSRAGTFAKLPAVVTTRHDLIHSPYSAEYGSGVDAVVCPSQALADTFTKLGAGDKVHVVYDGVMLPTSDRALEDRSDLRAKYRHDYCPEKEKPLFVVNIAPLEEDSRQADILEAMTEAVAVLPQTHLLIMGEGALAEELMRQRKVTALEKDVTFIEPDKAFLRLLAAADLYVSASKNDVSGCMVQAAMAAGTASVLTPTGCYPELIEDGKSGVFVNPSADQPLKSAMLELLENRSRREHMAKAAKARAAKMFDNSTQAGEVAGIYRRITGKA